MEEHNEITTMLALIPQPAFLVEAGKICHVNPAAAGCLLQVGQEISPLILCGAEEYEEFTGGCLYLTLSLANQPVGASVVKLDGRDIFTLDQTADLPQLQALSLAAMELRKPLSGILSLADQLLPAIAQENQQMQEQTAQMNRRLYQLLRIVSNMSDASMYAAAQPTLTEHVEICSFAEEILKKAGLWIAQIGIRLEYDLPREPIFLLAHSEKLERAIYNMLSNACKHAPKDSVIQVKLTQKNKRVYFSVSNQHTGTALPGDLFSRFLRLPGLEGGQNGIGLGMLLVRETAKLHDGVILADQTETVTRITMTLKVQQSQSSQLRSPRIRIDYAGERDHCLQELADILPAHLYAPDIL